MDYKRIGIDIAKNVFQLHGVDSQDKAVLKKKLKRSEMIPYFTQLKPCQISMEACGSSHYWSRKLTELGHNVHLIAPQHVKPYVQGGKNDANDAQAICEADSRPHMNYVSTKTEAQQAMQLVHRARHVATKARTALLNEIRGTLSEFGIICPTLGAACTRSTLSKAMHDDSRVYPQPLPQLLELLELRLGNLDSEINTLDGLLAYHQTTDERVKRLQQIEGIGPITASAIVCSVDAKQFNNSRDFSAWLGLTPRQNSSGGKERLGGITKRGDSYLRTLLIHGARNVVRYCIHKTDERSLWLQSLLLRRHANVVAVASANKVARVIWAMLVSGADYRVPKLVALETS
jgi:transposase